MFDSKRLDFTSKLLFKLKVDTYIRYLDDPRGYVIKHADMTRDIYYKIFDVKYRDYIIVIDDLGLPKKSSMAFV